MMHVALMIDTSLVVAAIALLLGVGDYALQTRAGLAQQRIKPPPAVASSAASLPINTQQLQQLAQRGALQPAHTTGWQHGLEQASGTAFVIQSVTVASTEAAGPALQNWQRFATSAELQFTLIDESGLTELQARIDALPGLPHWQRCELARAAGGGISGQCSLQWSGFGLAEAAR